MSGGKMLDLGDKVLGDKTVGDKMVGGKTLEGKMLPTQVCNFDPIAVTKKVSHPKFFKIFA